MEYFARVIKKSNLDTIFNYLSEVKENQMADIRFFMPFTTKKTGKEIAENIFKK